MWRVRTLIGIVLIFLSVKAFSDEKFDLYVESGIHHSARSVAFSADGRYVAAGSLDRVIKIWQLNDGREVVTLPSGVLAHALLFIRHNRLASANEDGSIHLWDLAGPTRVATLTCAARAAPIGLADDDATLLCADEGAGLVRRWDVATGAALAPFPLGPGRELGLARLAADGTLLRQPTAAGDTALLDGGTSRAHASLPVGAVVEGAAIGVARRAGWIAVSAGDKLAIWSLPGAPALARLEHELAVADIHALRFSPDEALLACATESGDILLFDTKTWREIRRIKSSSNRIENAGLTASSDVLAVQVWYDTRLSLDLKTGVLKEGAAPAGGDAAQWNMSGKIGEEQVVIKNKLDSLQLLRPDGTLVCTIVFLDKQKQWVVVTPEGRFDTNMDLMEVTGVHWWAAPRWDQPLPLEIFMRDYFEPRLLPRLFGGAAAAFKSVPPQSSLDRVQPLVRIVDVAAVEGTDFADVTVEAAGQGRSVHDLRLFRQGQLVAQWGGANAAPVPAADELDRWRRSTRLLDAGQERATRRFRVRLARRDAGKPVLFSAYAFNQDRVKSDTSRHTGFVAPARPAPPQPRAYVITMGVDVYDNPALRLGFAAKDARDIGDALAHIDGYDTVRLSLISEHGPRGALRQATKGYLRSLLALLAGKPDADAARLSSVRGLDRQALAKLRPATPDDLVVFAFSGHGYARPGDQFYLLSSDSGTWPAIAGANVRKFISSTELAEWLRAIDAGQFAMIIDACHSAGSVDDGAFKPGPMGDSSLGQLAYDKGMVVLAATQASDVALESGAIRQGLLTYALVREGFSPAPGHAGRVRGDLDNDGRLTLVEWLRYAEARVPVLYSDMRAGRLPVVRGGPRWRDAVPLDAQWLTKLAERAQTPALFDFQRNRLPVELVGSARATR